MIYLQDISASLCFRGQRIFLHNATGWFGSVPLEASGDFGLHPEDGEFHLMCQVKSISIQNSFYGFWIVASYQVFSEAVQLFSQNKNMKNASPLQTAQGFIQNC